MSSALIPAMVAWTAFAQAPSKGVNFYSVAHEIQLGRQASVDLERVLPMVHEPKLDAYVARLGSELAKRADPQFAYTFAFYDDRKRVTVQPVAVAMPADAFTGEPAEAVAVAGGRILIPLSLLTAVPSEPVFAFQLAHSVAHISMRHATRFATRMGMAKMADAGLEAQKFPFPRGGEHESFVASVPSQQLELEADKEAARIVAEVGYNPEAAIPYLKGPSSDEVVFSAHPTISQRAEKIRSVLATLPSRTYSVGDTAAFAEAKAVAARAR